MPLPGLAMGQGSSLQAPDSSQTTATTGPVSFGSHSVTVMPYQGGTRMADLWPLALAAVALAIVLRRK